jgi:hypothetical protein
MRNYESGGHLKSSLLDKSNRLDRDPNGDLGTEGTRISPMGKVTCIGSERTLVARVPVTKKIQPSEHIQTLPRVSLPDPVCADPVSLRIGTMSRRPCADSRGNPVRLSTTKVSD